MGQSLYTVRIKPRQTPRECLIPAVIDRLYPSSAVAPRPVARVADRPAGVTFQYDRHRHVRDLHHVHVRQGDRQGAHSIERVLIASCMRARVGVGGRAQRWEARNRSHSCVVVAVAGLDRGARSRGIDRGRRRRRRRGGLARGSRASSFMFFAVIFMRARVMSRDDDDDGARPIVVRCENLSRECVRACVRACVD